MLENQFWFARHWLAMQSDRGLEAPAEESSAAFSSVPPQAVRGVRLKQRRASTAMSRDCANPVWRRPRER
jgi:hypothetical protein